MGNIVCVDLINVENILKGIPYEELANNTGIFYTKEPNELFVIEPNKIRSFGKVPQITSYIILEDIKLLEAMNDRYVPIIDHNTQLLLFSEQEFYDYRRKMSGIESYGTGDFIFSDNLSFEGLDYYLDRIEENEEKVRQYRQPVIDEVVRLLSQIGKVSLGCNSGEDIELVEAGSTARYTNIPSDDDKKWDFDFTVRFNPEYTWKVKELLENGLMARDHITRTSRYKVRLLDVLIPGLDEKVDLDFSLTPQLDKYLSTEEVLSERLNRMRQQDYERYKLVVANIMYAKKLLKDKGAYKPSRGILNGDRANGGLGGVGIENWILQYGGSLLDAAQDFVNVAQDREFIDFEKHYSIMDFGCNHVNVSKKIWPYDNFVVNNMRYLGYEKMKGALQEFLIAQHKNFRIY